jgi:NAD(P)-dependent dehydrogenase (short-subunit alcohol dehydrogenase family)
MQSIVVTGASSGIGWACVKVLTASGFRVFGSVRKAEDADRLSRAFGASFTPLVFDVTDEAAVAAGAALVGTALGGETLAGLVNNAGIAVPGPLIYLAIADFKQQLAVNVTGQLIVTQHFAPLLGTDQARRGRPGRIVMISSVSGKNAAPFVGAYSASKFAIEGLSEALRRELMPFGIEVVIIGPGAVATPIWDKADAAADTGTFDGTPYAAAIAKMRGYMIAQGRNGLPPERIGEAVKTALTAAKPRTRYPLSPTPFQTWLVTALPKRMADSIFARRLGLTRRALGAPSGEDRQ